MDIKSIIKYVLIIGLVFFLGYLIFDLINGDITRKKDAQVFCTEKCGYNQNSFFWEFTGEDITKGFTTKDECFNYCEKSKEGFVYRFVNDSYASIMSSPFLANLLKTFGSK